MNGCCRHPSLTATIRVTKSSYHIANPRTQTLGDFHPTLCYPRDYCMGSFPCGTILPIASAHVVLFPR